MILGVHHVAISVPDLEAAKSFYRDMFGFEDVFDGQWHGDSPLVDAIMGEDRVSADMQMMHAGNVFLEIWCFSHPKPMERASNAKVMDHGYSHICLRVDDVHTEYERLNALGMAFLSPPQGSEGFLACYGKDPFGNIVELLTAPDSLSPKATQP